MDLLIVSGFLGSGKTSLVLALVERIRARRNKKIVVVVNDFGSIGIDARVMEAFGLEVKEIPSGCICCTLGPDLLKTLRAAAEGFAPDLIVIEPSGVADPGAIQGLLKHYDGPPIHSVRVFALIDALRHEAISRALPKLVRSQMEAADLILINKADQVTAEAIAGIESGVRGLGIRTRTIPTSARDGTGLDEIVEAMEV